MNNTLNRVIDLILVNVGKSKEVAFMRVENSTKGANLYIHFLEKIQFTCNSNIQQKKGARWDLAEDLCKTRSYVYFLPLLQGDKKNYPLPSLETKIQSTYNIQNISANKFLLPWNYLNWKETFVAPDRYHKKAENSAKRNFN